MLCADLQSPRSKRGPPLATHPRNSRRRRPYEPMVTVAVSAVAFDRSLVVCPLSSARPRAQCARRLRLYTERTLDALVSGVCFVTRHRLLCLTVSQPASRVSLVFACTNAPAVYCFDAPAHHQQCELGMETSFLHISLCSQ